MSNTDRHLDTGKWLASFADEVLVTCTDCGSPGVVHATWARCWNARFTCSGCQLALSSEAGDWVGPVIFTGRRPCGFCGYQWLAPTVEYAKTPVHPPIQIAVDCPECGRQTQVDASMERSFPADRCCDPHFGLPLRLATTTRHGTIWAYNLRHLSELSGYVTAKLRERNGSGNDSMFSRLPKWMKIAKNRDDIEKALCKLKDLA